LTSPLKTTTPVLVFITWNCSGSDSRITAIAVLTSEGANPTWFTRIRKYGCGFSLRSLRPSASSALTVCFNAEDAEITQRAAEKAQNKKVLTGILATPIVTEVMISTRTFFYFAFTYRFFFNEESGPAKFESDVLKT
jgi:hypothetical protein